jgi:magnesium transporter
VLADTLALHDLAVEDAVGQHQRPKLDHYDSHQFLVAHHAAIDPVTAQLTTSEVDVFIGTRWLVTVRKDRGFAIEPVVQRWDRNTDRSAHGVAFLLYELLDEIVDRLFDAVETLDEYYDRVAEGIFEDRPLPPSEQRYWFGQRQSLVRLHRLAVATREALSALMRHEHTTMAPPLYPYYQDLYDHVLVITESTESLRELVSSIVETNLSLRDYRQNQAMRKVTSWAAIIAVPTLITGWYGMNVPYPGEGEPWGVIAALALVMAASGLLYAVFRRRGWL